ncbi:phage baseplate plug family protein [Avibacterium avium]|uniref:phage baseplate plug family protein n=1 Tax=Avibacterium avium TaxID=751 RepID=UPI003BF7A6E8
MFTIQLANKNDFITEVNFDDEVFFLHFSWNDTLEFWTLAIENAYNDELVSNIVLLPNRPLIEPVRREDLPLGELIIVREDDSLAIGREDFINGKATLIYIEVDDELSVST